MIRNLFLVGILLSGAASSYADGVMERSAVNQYHLDHIDAEPPPGTETMICLADCGLLNRIVYVRHQTGEWKQAWVVDCASKSDRQSDTAYGHPDDDRSGYQWMKGSGIVAELQWNLWKEYRKKDDDLSDGVNIEVFIPDIPVDKHTTNIR